MAMAMAMAMATMRASSKSMFLRGHPSLPNANTCTACGLRLVHLVALGKLRMVTARTNPWTLDMGSGSTAEVSGQGVGTSTAPP